MLRKRILLSLLCATVLLASLLNTAVSPVAKAALRPGDMENIIKNSPEALVVEVVSVKQSVKQDERFDEFIKRRRRRITVAAEVKVLRVERSKTRLKKDDRIVIKYTIVHPDDRAGMAGGGHATIIEQGSVYEALVRFSDRDRIYKPEAYSSSFIQVHNGRGKTLQSCSS
jgi:hypothetical protein